MAKPVSISAKAISAAAKASVAKAVDKHKALAIKPGHPVGFFPRPLIFGFVMDSAELDKATFANAQQLAGDVHAEIARAMPAVKAGSPNIAFGGGHIICGFFPPVEIEMIEE
jgi:hypothetical protein